MRILTILFALMFAVPAFAGQARTPRGQVVAYECSQINPAEAGFTCSFENGRPKIQWHKKTSEMSETKRQRAKYEFNKIALRYFEFGGTAFPVYADFWPGDHYRLCYHISGRPWFEFNCVDYTKR